MGLTLVLLTGLWSSAEFEINSFMYAREIHASMVAFEKK